MKLIAVLALTLASLSACSDDTCAGDSCVCTDGEDCAKACDEGGAVCATQGPAGGALDVVCDHNASCTVECTQSTSCTVDCGGSEDCRVTCPAGGCTVTDCSEANGCTVSCGATGEATYSGSTATCS